MNRIFLLSPANCGGRRAKQVLSPRRAVRAGRAAALARRRAARRSVHVHQRPVLPRQADLRAPVCARRRAGQPDRRQRRARHHAERRPAQPRHAGDARAPCARSPAATSTRTTPRTGVRSKRARARCAREIGPDCDVVLLGSIASPKYVDVLLGDFRRAAAVSDRLRRPRRHEPRRPAAAAAPREGVELEYVPVAGAVAATARGRRSCRRCVAACASRRCRGRVARVADRFRAIRTTSCRSTAARSG